MNGVLLQWKEICLMNKKLSSFGFLTFLKEAQLLPNLIGIDSI